MSCMYGCATDGTSTCATSCPSGQGLCGGVCADLSSPSHCGTGCATCQGVTPYCSGGSCVQCTIAANCSPPGSVCSSSHTCQCRPQSSTNLLKDANFNDATLSMWSPTTGAHWATDDADGCQGSGSVYFSAGSITQCVTVKSNTRYYFGLHYHEASANNVYCSYAFFTGPGCTGSSPTGGPIFQSTAVNVWATLSAYADSGSAVSASFTCDQWGTDFAELDQVYAGTSDGY
jgi:hypothetical protein